MSKQSSKTVLPVLRPLFRSDYFIESSGTDICNVYDLSQWTSEQIGVFLDFIQGKTKPHTFFRWKIEQEILPNSTLHLNNLSKFTSDYRCVVWIDH